MTPLSLGAAAASAPPATGTPARTGAGNDKQAGGFDALLQAAPQSADFLGEMLIWTTQRWKGADTIESAVEEFIEQMKKQAEQPKQPGPDEMKAQAEVMKAQASVKVAEIGVQQKQLELEADMVRHRQEMEKMAFEAANPQLRQEPQPQQNRAIQQ